MSDDLTKFITQYADFPKKGVLFRDILPVLQHPDNFLELIKDMSSSKIIKKADAIISIDARGFIFGTAIAMQSLKPMIVARKVNKLPGDLLTRSYDLEYGQNSLSIQKSALKNYQSFVIIDDLLATGGTATCVSSILRSAGKDVTGLSVVIELEELKGRSCLTFPVESQVIL